ncbi:hypothetical protein CR513_01360, partial [Mucuna pruriens]
MTITMDKIVVVQPKKTKEHKRKYPPERSVKMNKFIPPGQSSLTTQLSSNHDLRSLDQPSVIEALCTTKMMESVLEILRKETLYANLKKCTFSTYEVVFLGYVVDSHGVKVDKEKVKVIQEWPTLKNVSKSHGHIPHKGFKEVKSPTLEGSMTKGRLKKLKGEVQQEFPFLKGQGRDSLWTRFAH